MGAALVKSVITPRYVCAKCGVTSKTNSTWWTQSNHPGPHRHAGNSEWRFTGQLCVECGPTTINGTYEQFEEFIKLLYITQRLETP